MKRCSFIFLALSAAALGPWAAGCGGASPRFGAGSTTASTKVTQQTPHELRGIASYYADEFNGRTTSNGEIYDMHELTAAHRTLPFDTLVRVRNLANNKEVVVRINDRGPFKDDRIIDLSLEAAKRIGLVTHGTAAVELDVLEGVSAEE